MKVRYLHGGCDMDIIEESPHWYICRGREVAVAVEKALVQVVPDEQWEDVTDSIHQHGEKHEDGQFISSGVDRIAKLICGGRYRLRTIRYGERHLRAFIVERKVP